MKKPLNKMFSVSSRGRNKLSSDTILSNQFKEEVTKISRNRTFSYLWQPSKSKFSWRNECGSLLAFPASNDVLKKVWGQLVHSPRTVFLRSISEIERAVSGRHSLDSTTKQNFKNNFIRVFNEEQSYSGS